MNRIYILAAIYTSENSAGLKDTTLSEMYPQCAGDYDILIKNLSSKLKNIITTNNKRLNL